MTWQSQYMIFFKQGKKMNLKARIFDYFLFGYFPFQPIKK